MEDNQIIIGSKPVGIYLKVVRKKLSQNKEIILKTRGKLISTACFIACVIIEEKNFKVKNIKLISSKYKDKEGKEKLVPEIEITIIKG